MKKMINLANLLSNIATLHITTSGLTISAMDQYQIAMAKLMVQKTSFETYDATRFKLGLDIDRMKKIVDLAKSNEIIDVQYKQNQLVVSIEEIKTKMGVIDLFNIPDVNSVILNNSGHALLKSDKLRRALIASNGISENVLLGIDREKLELRAKKDVNSVKLRLKKEELIELESKQYHESRYPIKHLENLFQYLPNDAIVQISFGDQTPLQIVHDFDNGMGHMIYNLVSFIEPL